MPKSVKPFKWDDAAKESVLNYVFEGRLSQAAIAKICNISSRTVAYWIAHPDFQARLEEKRADLEQALYGVTYAKGGGTNQDKAYKPS
jgi:transposase-like protein